MGIVWTRGRWFRIRGGVHPEDHKNLSAEKPIATLPMPDRLYIPLQQHIGAPAEAVVKIGDRVKKGQLLGRAQGRVSAPVHAPTSGEIVAIGRHPAPHPSGLPIRTITLAADGRDEWGSLPPPLDPRRANPEDIARRVGDCGIVGMGGATFPSAVKLNLRERYALKTLVINGAECEPYLTCDDRLMREHGAEVLDGVDAMRRALGAADAIVAIENNKPQAIDAMSLAARAFSHIRIVAVPARYPMGSEKHLVHALTGRETPARGLTADIGVVVHNAATAFAVHEAVRHGRPLIRRVVTISGEAIKTPANLWAPIGTRIAELIAFTGGLTQDAPRLLLGGPMMGAPLADTATPIVKASGGVLALDQGTKASPETRACIRCARCVDACPSGLMPLEMVLRIRKEDLQSAVAYGLLDCVGCGACAYTCPSKIPLVQYFNYAKGRMAVEQREAHRNTEIKRLVEARAERMERLARAKKEALAKRMAARKKTQNTAARGASDAPAEPRKVGA
ncbi:electron transport complex subunit RsxC [Varunaivibrio sulfuroxidans]|uniref:Ion-translocating oxidoreductase complex subunit C n=1 Tax=Varunaivibrio sulfuroxidans TaxID=1773489 RepID=A0A4R3J790_9PROT|nr:electron transport complex subunit RsxC [Varunaivibrio sulfuroxidans]TCS61728.1 electron transport complex protein RnfC [Varunaivibrio sulfuroxidans]WES32087.1 electron transport complex subunit RsxC [Varunaivibrio sulfuroxidans]